MAKIIKNVSNVNVVISELPTNDMEMEAVINLVNSKPSLLQNTDEMQQMDCEINLEILDNAEACELAGTLGPIFLRHTTLIKECDAKCIPINNAEAKKIQEIILNICSSGVLHF